MVIIKEHFIELTSAELASLWSSYLAETAALPIMKYFDVVCEDAEVQSVLNVAKNYSKRHIDELKEIFSNENYPVPNGFSDKDVDLQAPKLYSDTYMLSYLRNFGKTGLASNGMASSFAARKDVREYYKECLLHAYEVEELAKELMLSKGVFIRPPNISKPKTAEYVHNEGFLRGWLGERRTLTGEEIAHIHMNLINNTYAEALVLGFAQVAKSKEVKKYFLRCIEFAKTFRADCRVILEESTLPAPQTWDTEVKESTTPPFSDRLMMFQVSEMNAMGLANIGGSLALSLRRDLALNYLKHIKNIGFLAEDGAEIMIKNGWFERPPQAVNRRELT